jgi:hypothetical protein
MPHALPVRNVSRSVPKFSPAGIAILQFAIAGIVVLALAVTLSVYFPIGPSNSGWDAGSYLAAFDH